MDEYRFLTMLGEYIKTCPHPAPVGLSYNLIGSTGINYGRIVAAQGSDRLGAGLLLRCTGATSPTDSTDVLEEVVLSKRRVNFALELWRSEGDEEYIVAVVQFLQQIVNWINKDNYSRGKPTQNPKLPVFGMTDSERISADGIIRTPQAKDGRAIYVVQIHCDYEVLIY